MYYVYVYTDPTKPGNYTYGELIFTHEPFYIGKGKDDRLYDHLKRLYHKTKHDYTRVKKQRLLKIIESGVQPNVYKLYDNLTEDDALRKEKETILLIGRVNLGLGVLLNLNNGGHKPQDGYKHTKETRIKIGAGSKKQTNKNYKLISPTGQVFENVNLVQFCREQKLNYDKIRKCVNTGSIHIVIKGRSSIDTLNCEGWAIEHLKRTSSTTPPKFTLVSPDGMVYNVAQNYLYVFCKEHNLCPRTLRRYRGVDGICVNNTSTSNANTLNCNGWSFYGNRNKGLD